MNRELLEKPFEKEQIKQRKGSFGDMIDYVEAHAVIQRLNDAFDGNWSFEIITNEKQGEEIVVLGKLSADGVSKMQFGSKKITFNSKTGEVVCLGDDIKAAASDCLKKCSTLLGVGLHLYSDREEQPKEKDMSKMSKSKAKDTVSETQLAQIKDIRTKLGWTPKQVQDIAERMFGTRKVGELNTVMANGLIAYLQTQGDGSKDEKEAEY